MNNLLRIIGRELDPRHDFDRFGKLNIYEREYGDKSTGEVTKQVLLFGFNALTKHMVRYGLPAAGFGALAYSIAGEDPGKGALGIGALFGIADVFQCFTRGYFIPGFIDMGNRAKKRYLTVSNFLQRSSNREV